MSLMFSILRLSGAVPKFFSFSHFFDCFVLIVHKIVEMQFE